MGEEIKILESIIITPLLKAKSAFEEALALEKNDISRDACIQRFEFTFELSWKFMKRVLSHRGLDVNSPREVFREAAKEGLISDPNVWFDFLNKRNLTVHTYNKEVAEEIYASLNSFQSEVDSLVSKLLEL